MARLTDKDIERIARRVVELTEQRTRAVSIYIDPRHVPAMPVMPPMPDYWRGFPRSHL